MMAREGLERGWEWGWKCAAAQHNTASSAQSPQRGSQSPFHKMTGQRGGLRGSGGVGGGVEHTSVTNPAARSAQSPQAAKRYPLPIPKATDSPATSEMTRA